MKIFMNIWGYEKPLHNHHHFYNNLLKLLRVYLPPINMSFVEKCAFKEPATEFGILQLALSLFPRSYFTEILAVLEWSLTMNKVILESLTTRIQTLGILALDNVTALERLQEYAQNIELCREAIQAHMDDVIAQGDGDSFVSRFGIARATCKRLTADFARQLDMETKKPAAVKVITSDDVGGKITSDDVGGKTIRSRERGAEGKEARNVEVGNAGGGAMA